MGANLQGVGVDVKLVSVHFLFGHEAKNDFGMTGWGGVGYGGRGKPDVVVVYPYKEGKNGFYLDWAELRNTCYHELIHLLLRNDIEEEDVEKMGDIINRRQKGWCFWCSYLSERAIALGLGPPDMGDESMAVSATAKKRHMLARANRKEGKMATRDLVERFLINNVSIFGEDPHFDLNPCYIGVAQCLDRLPRQVVTKLIENTIVHIPQGRPSVINVREPVAIIILPESMESWPWKAIIGAIAHEFAHIIGGNLDDNEANGLANLWGFEKEIEASQRMSERLVLARLLGKRG